MILCNVFLTDNVEGSYQCYFSRTKENSIIKVHVSDRRKRKESPKYCPQFWLTFSELLRERAHYACNNVSCCKAFRVGDLS